MSRARTVLRAHPPPLRRPRNLRPFFRTPPHEPLQSRIRWSYFWYASILALGITTGLGARHFAAPLGLPAPGSREDEIILESLGQDIDALDIVKTLRSQSYNLHGDTALRSGPGLRGESGSSGGGGGGGRKISAYKGWVEVSLDWGKVDDEHAEKSGILGVVRGTRGLGVQRAFWNAETKEMVAVVWMGGGLSGWPGVVHGGLIATVFEEVMARMVSGPEGRVDTIHRPNTLSLTYAKPTYSLDFYILRASFSKPDLPQTQPPPPPSPPSAEAETQQQQQQSTKRWLSWLSPEKDLTKKKNVDVGGGKQKSEIVATLESVKGDLCVKAKGTFEIGAPR